MNSITAIPVFSAIDADPGGTLKLFDDYIRQMRQMRQMEAMTLLKGGKDMHTMFEHIGNVLEEDTFEEAITKIQTRLKERTNKIVQRNMLLSNFPQGEKYFEKWSLQISEAAEAN